MDPAVLAVAADDGAAFLHQETVVRPGAGKFLTNDLFGLVVGGGNEVARSLEGDLQLLDLAEVSPEPARRLVGGP